MSMIALLADVGGTNARFALLHGDVIGSPVVFRADDFATFDDALRRALSVLGATDITAVAVCAAGPPEQGSIAFTNRDWQVSESVLARTTSAKRVLLVNDFTALAAALPVLEKSDLRHLGGGSEDPSARAADCTRAVIGPGSGLGMSACLPSAEGYDFIVGEGGHVDLAASDAQEAQIISRLRERFDHVSAECVLSGKGLVNLYQGMYPDNASPTPQSGSPQSGPQIAALAASGDQRALACVQQFSAWLGAVSGDLALTVGARGGVYLTGGILHAWGELFPVEAFRTRFVAKGRYREYLSAIPTWLVTAPCPALIGLRELLRAPRAGTIG